MKRKIDMDTHLRDVWIKGEISNFNHHSRGHMYLTIKDDKTRIQAVMFAGNNRYLKFTPENGMQVLIRGEVSVFETYGQYQLYIKQMEPDGIGSLYLAFEQLKQKLQKQGLFESKYKKTIPIYPQHIGIVTSPTGAAVRDIITTIKRRYEAVSLTVLPVLVQGPLATDSVVKAIQNANMRGDFDVLIVARGGGSIEELWTFNEEKVAKAVFQSTIPVISAIGHETDMTICDLVADLRAPTPTGAAELAVPSQQELKSKIRDLKRLLHRQLHTHIESEKKHLERLRNAYAFKYPVNLVEQKEQEIDKFIQRMDYSFDYFIRSRKDQLGHLQTRLFVEHPMKQYKTERERLKQLIDQSNKHLVARLEAAEKKLVAEIDKLSLLNPLEVMRRGFAIPYTTSGEIIKSRKQVQKDSSMMVQLSDGTIDCKVLHVKEYNNDRRK